MNSENIIFFNDRNQRLAGRIFTKDIKTERGVIFCHGLFSNKDGYKITRLAESIVNEGYALLTFDFSFSGESGGNISDLSVLQEVRDLESAVRYFAGTGIKKFHIMGSSMGGVVSLLYAASCPQCLISLIVIATPVDLAGLLNHISGTGDAVVFPDDGMTALDGLLIKNTFFSELKSIDMEEEVRNISVPVLIIHGCQDGVVNFSNAKTIEVGLKTPFSTLYIDDGDHSLTRDSDLVIMKQHIAAWLARHRELSD